MQFFTLHQSEAPNSNIHNTHMVFGKKSSAREREPRAHAPLTAQIVTGDVRPIGREEIAAALAHAHAGAQISSAAEIRANTNRGLNLSYAPLPLAEEVGKSSSSQTGNGALALGF